MKIKTILSLTFLITIFISTHLNAQIDRINSFINSTEAESHLRFLAADELRGRNTGTLELNIAGRYIAEQFRRSGLIPLGDEQGDYLQQVPLYVSKPPQKASAKVLDMNFEFGADLGVINGLEGDVAASLLYVTDIEELENEDFKGKIVIVVLRDVRSAVRNLDRVSILQNGGAVGLIEIFGPAQQFPWPLVMNFLNREKMNIEEIDNNPALPHIWVRDTADLLIQKFNSGINGEATITLGAMLKTPVESYNIVGKIEGKDPKLKEEHLIMCAHYDHVGVQVGDGVDSIYNGTRDNAIGTTGLINAVKYFGEYPTKRSIIIIALTGEEKGLLGSQYYTNHPKIPLEESVFALNIDNSGYTNTEVITLLDTARTNIDELVYKAASEFGLGVIGDRLPGQNYYERSDQVSFAAKGVPAINFKMSMTAFDERISKFYHQPNDEVENVDLDYVNKYWKAYIRTAELIGNWDQVPYWLEGDKFETAGNMLYKK